MMTTSELVEREAALAALRARLLGAATAGGHVALLAGEAGIGKTSVLRVLAAGQAARGGAVWWGACDALQTPHPLAPLLDIARENAPRFAARLDGPRPALFEAVLDELRLAAGPLLLVIEDAHWADDASLDLLKFLGRRIARAPVLLAISYRDDELGLAHPLRRVIGELPAAALTRIELPRLTTQAVETLAGRAARPAAGIHAATHGNPFFVTELLRADTAAIADAAVAAVAVPATVQDLVLARFARLDDAAQALLRLASVVPARIERWLVDALLAPPLAVLEACLASGLLLAEGQVLSFRHELARRAIEAALSPPMAQALHGQVLAALLQRGDDIAAARMVHHAVAAGDRAAISRHAPLAATQAEQRGAHREATAQWRIALQRGQPQTEAQRCQWLESLALACGLTGRIDEALQLRRTLEQLARERGDAAEAAVQLARQALLSISQMRHADADRLNQQALALLQPLTPALAHLRVWHVEANLRMFNRDCAQSLQWAQQVMTLAEALGERELAVNALGTHGTALLFIDYEAGCAEMRQALQLQLADGKIPAATTTLGNLGSASGELMRLPEAEGFLREMLQLSSAHEIDNQTYYGQAWLSLCLLLRGRWDDSGALAVELLGRPGVAGMSRLMALLALARLRLRRGDPGADAALEEGLALTGSSNTLQRSGPLRAARAEAAFARGDLAAVRAEVAAALPLALAQRHPWFGGELAYWDWRAGGSAAPPPVCAEPYALQIGGRWRAAADAWRALDCPFECARALADGDAAAQREALAAFEALGARPAAEALRRRLREAGERGIARGARASTRRHPCGLTAAESEVLALLGSGLRNAEIAARLHRSVRTIDHHVAAVLAKLGAASRLEAVRRAEQEGWLAQSGQRPDAN